MFDIFFAIYKKESLQKEIRSKFPLAKFCIIDNKNTIQDALFNAQTRSLTKMFWFVVVGYEIKNDFNFNFIVPKWDQKYVHVFKEEHSDSFEGVFLIPKTYAISQTEARKLYFTSKKEIPIIASQNIKYNDSGEAIPLTFDIVFISYAEPNADENYENLIERFPRAKRIHGVKGIHQAHIEAAKIVETLMFWVVDGDAHIVENFNFDYQVTAQNLDTVHVWRSKNPINGLQYGYGGVKLLPTELTRNLDPTTVDMTTSISQCFKPMPMVSNISKFNTDEFNTWRSAFRECVKLSSKIIIGQNDKESLYRLDVWCTEGEDENFGKFALAGAKAGKEFGFRYKNNPNMLAKINDWKWLEEEFQKYKDKLNVNENS